MVNYVEIIGHLGADPEVKYSNSGVAVCNMNIATSRSWKDKQGEKQKETEWHRVTAFSRTAEVCGEYLKKGSLCRIAGRLQTRKWQDKDGNDRWTTEVVCDQMQMLGSRESNTATTGANHDQYQPLPGDIPDSDVPF